MSVRNLISQLNEHGLKAQSGVQGLPGLLQHIRLQLYMEGGSKSQYQSRIPAQHRIQQRTHQKPRKLYKACIPKPSIRFTSHESYKFEKSMNTNLHKWFYQK